MADELLDKVRDALEGQIDFEGQRLAELLTTVFLAATGLIAFVAGYITQDIHKTLWTGLAGTALTFLVVVPPWPFFNRHPESWLPPSTNVAALNIQVNGRKVD